MLCIKCGGECWDNTQKNIERAKEGKKNLPLYSCKNKEGCSWVMWPEKDGKKQILVNSPLPSKVPQVAPNDMQHKTMVLSYAKDLAIAKIAANGEIPNIGKEVIAIFNELWQGLTQQLGKV